MKPRIQLFIITLIVGSLMMSSLSLQKANRAKYRIRQAENRVKQAENRVKQAENLLKILRLSAVVKYSINNNENRSQDNFQKAIKIRNHIYQNVPLKPTPKNFDFMNMDKSYLSSLRDEEVGHICGGLAIIYATALESQGIPARYVGIYSRDKQPYDGHATIEFWHKGEWYASDPTFNVMFRREGEYLSYSELYDLIRNRESYEIISNGFPIFPKRAIERYYIKLEDLMKYMVIHPSDLWIHGKRLSYPMRLFPTTWDGAVTYDDGKRRDVKNFGGIYKFLNQGPLR